MQTPTDILLDRIRRQRETEAGHSALGLEKGHAAANEIATLSAQHKRALSPMLKRRFAYCGLWRDADLSQDWLSLDQIEHFRDNATLTAWLNLRIENWPDTPPNSVSPCDCTIFGYNPYEPEETYLVWTAGVIEPAVWRYFGGDVNVFTNLDRYFEYILGDRAHDDSEGVDD